MKGKKSALHSILYTSSRSNCPILQPEFDLAGHMTFKIMPKLENWFGRDFFLIHFRCQRMVSVSRLRFFATVK